MVRRRHPLLEQVLGPGFRIANPFKPHAVEAIEEWEGLRLPSKFHFRDSNPGNILQREAHINAQTRINFITDDENDYFKRDEEPGEIKLYRVIDANLVPAQNWRSPTLFEGNVGRCRCHCPPELEVGDVVVYEAHVTDPSRIEPFINRFALAVKAEREASPPIPKPPAPKPDKPGAEIGKDAQQDTKLYVPSPVQIWEKDWGAQQPMFDKFTAMRVSGRPPRKRNSTTSTT